MVEGSGALHLGKNNANQRQASADMAAEGPEAFSQHLGVCSCLDHLNEGVLPAAPEIKSQSWDWEVSDASP